MKWDYQVTILGIPEERITQVLDKVMDCIVEEGLCCTVGIGEESEGGSDD